MAQRMSQRKGKRGVGQAITRGGMELRTGCLVTFMRPSGGGVVLDCGLLGDPLAFGRNHPTLLYL